VKSRLCLIVVLALFWAAAGNAADAPQVALTILHTNDTHSHLKPFSYPDGARAEIEGLREHVNIGGIARRATLVKGIRQELEKRGSTVWLVDAGDYSDGTPFSLEYQGEADVAAMNAAGYDFGTLGNHEFNNSLAQLKKLISLTKYQLVCANAIERKTGNPLTAPYVIRTMGGLKIGIFGILTHEAASYRAGKEGVDVGDEFAAAKQVITDLHPKVDILVAISHAGARMDEKLGAMFPDIDVIIGGHSHSRLPSGEFIWHSEDLHASDVNGTVIVQAHQWGGELGRLDLLFSKNGRGEWKVDRYRSRLIPITSEIPDDPPVAAVVDKYWQEIAPKYGEVLGKATAEFISRGDDLAEYHLVDDALREVTQSEFAIGNLGGIRAPLLRGDITKGDIVTLDPFTNTVVTFKATGSQILFLLKRYAPSVSGIRYILRGEPAEVTIGGKAVEEGRIYSGVTNSYFAGVALKPLSIQVQDSGRVRMEVLAEYIRKKGTLTPLYDGRRVIVSRQRPASNQDARKESDVEN
jgi:2',3'-cyclic-nucleotide 2'-phosphodiesterase (5'-nucleotidase family)